MEARSGVGILEACCVEFMHYNRLRTSLDMAANVVDDADFTLIYFPLLAKGFGPALVAEFSGLSWNGPKTLNWSPTEWKVLKPTTTFGQLPLLKTKEGIQINQSTAVVNWIAKKAGEKLSGANEKDWVISQMLIAEGDELYAKLQQHQPTIYVELSRPDKFKGTPEQHSKWWSDWVVNHFQFLERMLVDDNINFTSTGFTVGELMLFSYLHQMYLVMPLDMFANTPKLKKWYESMVTHETVKFVLSGNSNFGRLKQYFIKP